MCKTTSSNRTGPVSAKRAAGGNIQLMHSLQLQQQLQQQQQQQTVQIQSIQQPLQQLQQPLQLAQYQVQLQQPIQQHVQIESIMSSATPQVIAPTLVQEHKKQTSSAAAAAAAAAAAKEELKASSDDEESDDEKESRGIKPACINCRRSKVRCEGGIPCRRCVRLAIDNSCQRCEPKKRGRKRKIRPATEETQLLESLFEQARQSKVVDVSTLLPARTPESLEKDEIERFASLTAQFRSWREQLTNDPNVEQADLMRFLWFCSYLSNIINAYIAQFVNPAQAQKLVSVWLCSNLADDVNRFVTSLGPDLVCFPNIDDISDLQGAVERQVFKSLPTGVVSLTLYPRPFAPGNKPWLNPKMCQMLGYTKDEARVLMSHRTFFLRLLHSSSYANLSSNFWQAVAGRKTSFTLKTKWVHRSGQVVETVGTFSIKYMHGLPVGLNMFFQIPPNANSRIQESEPVSAFASFKFNQDLANPAIKLQSPGISASSSSSGFSPVSSNSSSGVTLPPPPSAIVSHPQPTNATYAYYEASAAALQTNVAVPSTATAPNNNNNNNNNSALFPPSPADAPEIMTKPTLAYSKDEGGWDLSPLTMGPSAMLDLVLNPNPEF